MFENLQKNGDVLTSGDHSESVNKLFIHWSDYGDDYFDLVICYKETERMFGPVAWVAIPGYKIDNTLKKLKDITSITDVKKEKIKNWEV